MSSDRVGSFLRSTDKTDYAEFSWDKIIQELAVNAPTFLSLMSACTHTRREKNNRNAAVGMCAAIQVCQDEPGSTTSFFDTLCWSQWQSG